jgi:GNAT superfamily N-acetyltransferase
MDGLTLRPLVAADLPRLRELFAVSFGQNRAQAYDSWRFIDTPYGLAPTIVADDGEKLAGSYTIWPTMLNIGGEIVRGGQSMDTMTHPDYRGKGLFTKLAVACFDQLAKDGYEALYGFPNANSYPGFIKRLNWDHVGDVPHWSRLITPLADKPAPLAALSRVGTRLVFKTRTGGMQVESQRPDDATIDKVISQHTENKDLCRIERNASWYAWRYSPPFGRAYQWFTAYQGSEPQGFAVMGFDTSNETGGEAQLCELVGTDAAKAALIAAAVQACYKTYRKALKTITNDPAVIAALRENGFIRRSEMRTIVKPLTTRLLKANIHNFDAWRFMGGDFDVY